jgi:hypothetical protein
MASFQARVRLTPYLDVNEEPVVQPRNLMFQSDILFKRSPIETIQV